MIPNVIGSRFVMRNVCGFAPYEAVAGGDPFNNHATLSTDLISYYKFNANSSTQTDSHGSNDGTVVGASYNASGKLSGCYEFTGASDSINISDSSDFAFGNGGADDTAFSIAAWVYFDSVTGVQMIISKFTDLSNSAEWAIYNNGGELVFRLYDNAGNQRIGWATNTTPFSTSTWYHVVCTYDGTSDKTGMSLYVDGSEITSNTTQDAGTYYGMHNFSSDICWGSLLKNNATYDEWLDGRLDEGGIWGNELTSSEVSDLYNSGSGLAY